MAVSSFIGSYGSNIVEVFKLNKIVIPSQKTSTTNKSLKATCLHLTQTKQGSDIGATRIDIL